PARCVLFLHYLRHGYTFDRWTTFEDAARWADRVPGPSAVISAARKGSDGAHLLEVAADALGTRAADYLDGLPRELAERFDPAAHGKNYLVMQENICDLTRDGRKLLGLKLREAILALRVDETHDMIYAAAYVDYKPDFLYVLAASKGFDRTTVLKRGLHSLLCGLPYYGKKAGLFIADRDGKSFEVVYLSGVNASQ